MKGLRTVLVYTVILFATIGFFYQLFFQTTSLFNNILILAGIGAFVYLLVYLFKPQQRMTDELKKYRRAAKMTNRRFAQTQKKKKNSTQRKVTPIAKKRASNPPHLRVIEGKKANKKDRASL
ncbi:hypothetical protein SAMN04488134_10636 [Amphibacillus marinus]|uniref:Uncharacterized protein n=1 Tax=Amphibacillus marinus TaxID=872970 RepID=A0A1H8NM82_9BACI|nr:SA1362 family protein [Amphibacillus marinus]SEO30720.1 hypothetical protein SAMN04488134_10636 [Amphibacillus marinus]